MVMHRWMRVETITEGPMMKWSFKVWQVDGFFLHGHRDRGQGLRDRGGLEGDETRWDVSLDLEIGEADHIKRKTFRDEVFRSTTWVSGLCCEVDGHEEDIEEKPFIRCRFVTRHLRGVAKDKGTWKRQHHRALRILRCRMRRAGSVARHIRKICSSSWLKRWRQHNTKLANWIRF